VPSNQSTDGLDAGQVHLSRRCVALNPLLGKLSHRIAAVMKPNKARWRLPRGWLPMHNGGLVN